MEPRYEHDCDCCKFVGQFDKYDLYWHGTRERGQWIARDGIHGDYVSSGGSTLDRLLMLTHNKRN